MQSPTSLTSLVFVAAILGTHCSTSPRTKNEATATVDNQSNVPVTVTVSAGNGDDESECGNGAAGDTASQTTPVPPQATQTVDVTILCAGSYGGGGSYSAMLPVGGEVSGSIPNGGTVTCTDLLCTTSDGKEAGAYWGKALVLASGPDDAETPGCHEVDINQDVDATLPADLQIALTVTPSTATLYSDSVCSTPATTLAVKAGTKTAVFYFKDTADDDSVSITASAPNFPVAHLDAPGGG